MQHSYPGHYPVLSALVLLVGKTYFGHQQHRMISFGLHILLARHIEFPVVEIEIQIFIVHELLRGKLEGRAGKNEANKDAAFHMCTNLGNYFYLAQD